VHPPIFTVILLSLIIGSSGCETKIDSIVDSIGAPPVLSFISLTPSTVNSDSINVGSNRNPSDTLVITAELSVRATGQVQNPVLIVTWLLRSPSNTRVVSSGEIHDDGTGLDQSKGDGTFTGKLTFLIRRVEIGVFHAEVSALSQNGFQSNTYIAPLSIYRGNRPPTLLSVVAPDSVNLANQTQALTLHVKASDPDGSADLARVVFNSFKPDGTASGGNPFQMYDDGSSSHGDGIAGDGIYSLIISLPSTTVTGTYRFEFQAFDRSNESSSTIVHRVTVRQ
jgi:hypothetical protein